MSDIFYRVLLQDLTLPRLTSMKGPAHLDKTHGIKRTTSLCPWAKEGSTRDLKYQLQGSRTHQS